MQVYFGLFFIFYALLRFFTRKPPEADASGGSIGLFSLGNRKLHQMRNALNQQIDTQNHQGNHRSTFHLHLCLKLVNHQRNRLIGSGCKEGNGRNGHHTVNKEIREHFKYSQCLFAVPQA